MDNQFVSLIVLILGAAIGFGISWMLIQGRILAATEQAKGPLNEELAKLRQHNSDLEVEKEERDSVFSDLHKQVGQLREESKNAKVNEVALQDARDKTIPDLERRLKELGDELKIVQRLKEEHSKDVSRLTAELTAEQDKTSLLKDQLNQEKTKHERVKEEQIDLHRKVEQLTEALKHESNKTDENLKRLSEARDELSNQFKALASEVLTDKAKVFAEQNQENLGKILGPLKEDISGFKNRVNEIHHNDTVQQSMLRQELAQLKELNRQITEEAHGLAVALKGQAKKQGNWGELVLGNVLDRSGLRDGQDFKREVSFNTDDGRRRPDVIVYLPQNKHLVIDAKVSLNAYTRYVNSENDIERQQAIKEHVSAVANRIQELSNRSYFDLPGLNTPEIVFMFIPIESAFVEALRADENLFQKAIEQNVLVATPTTLLTSLNIVRQLWRFEEQNAHSAELADRAGRVYKKLVNFLHSFEAMGSQLDKAKDSYNKAWRQLVEGPGNLINQANEFGKLGVSIRTPIPEHLAKIAALEIEHVPLTNSDMTEK